MSVGVTMDLVSAIPWAGVPDQLKRGQRTERQYGETQSWVLSQESHASLERMLVITAVP